MLFAFDLRPSFLVVNNNEARIDEKEICMERVKFLLSNRDDVVRCKKKKKKKKKAHDNSSGGRIIVDKMFFLDRFSRSTRAYTSGPRSRQEL